MIYKVYFKKLSDFRWQVLKNVKGDGLMEGTSTRYFILDDETRVEIPTHDVIFKFTPGRFIMIKKQMELEAGQSIPTNDGIR